jgi:hypothetical protein
MRIISDYHDYYDKTQEVDQDRSLVYLRERRVVKLPTTSWLPKDWGRAWFNPNHALRVLKRRAIGFCGRVYPVLQLTHADELRFRGEAPKINCYAAADVDAFITEHFSKDDQELYFSPEPKTGGRGCRSRRGWERYRWRESDQAAAKRWFDAFGPSSQKALAHVFLQERTPVFVADMTKVASVTSPGRSEGTVLEVNCSLREYDFVRIKDVYTAFQEISMFLGSLAFPNKTIPHVSDDDMAAAKGFDKWSFRKPPGKKKKK